MNTEGLDEGLELHISTLHDAASNWHSKKRSIDVLSCHPRPFSAHTIAGRGGQLTGDRKMDKWSVNRASSALQSSLRDPHPRVREHAIMTMIRRYSKSFQDDRYACLYIQSPLARSGRCSTSTRLLLRGLGARIPAYAPAHVRKGMHMRAHV